MHREQGNGTGKWAPQGVSPGELLGRGALETALGVVLNRGGVEDWRWEVGGARENIPTLVTSYGML